MRRIVTSYVNPDLDGVACCIAAEELEPRWTAALLGEVDAETAVVLRLLDIDSPKVFSAWGDVKEVWLVDTHHPKQLPTEFPHQLVTRITDHHPAGDVARYAAAEIQNEMVGAAATLMAEQFDSAKRRPTDSIAQLLQAAILSNTLELGAPSTSDRDRRALNALKAISPLSEEIVGAMREARRGVLALTTEELLARDAKVFDTRHGQVAVAQVEAPGALELLSRADLLSAMHSFARSQKSESAVLSVVDTSAGRGAIMATDRRIATALRDGHSMHDSGELIIRFDRLIQRKTDILPFITST